MILSELCIAGITLGTVGKIYQQRRKQHAIDTWLQPPTPPELNGQTLSESLYNSMMTAVERVKAENLPTFLGSQHRRQVETFSSSNKDKDYKITGALQAAKEIPRDVNITAVSLGLATAGALFYTPLGLLSIPGSLYVMQKLAVSTYQAVFKERRTPVDILSLIIIAVCIVKGYFFLCTLNLFFAGLSRKLLTQIRNDSRDKVVDVFRQHPQSVWVLVDDVEIEIPFEALKAEDVVIVSAGETIPADGYIVSGLASIDQHVLTGEAQPVEKEVGDAVFALTIVLSGRIHIEVEKAGEDSSAAQISQLLNQTINFKSDMQFQVEAASERSVIPMLLISGVSVPVLGPMGAISVLNSHPRYKIIIANYLGILKFFDLATQKGLLIKDGRILELLNQVDTVVFDKTGTLTQEQPHVGCIHTFGSYREDELLAYAAAAEARQTHPIARAILHEARTRALSVPEVDGAEYRIGYGLTVTVGDKLVQVGSARFMEMEDIPMTPQIHDLQRASAQQGSSIVYVAVGTEATPVRIVGAIELHVTVRPEAKAIIEGLRRFNIQSTYIISGDHETPTRNLAEALGIDHYFAETLPADKADLIDQLQREGKSVCYIGDGINDAIALKTATVSISLRGASTVATDTAQVILMDQSLNRLCDLFELARGVDLNTKRTVGSMLVPCLIGFTGALFFNLQFLGSVIMNNASLAVGVTSALLPEAGPGRMRLREIESKHVATSMRIGEAGQDK